MMHGQAAVKECAVTWASPQDRSTNQYVTAASPGRVHLLVNSLVCLKLAASVHCCLVRICSLRCVDRIAFLRYTEQYHT